MDFLKSRFFLVFLTLYDRLSLPEDIVIKNLKKYNEAQLHQRIVFQLKVV